MPLGRPQAGHEHNSNLPACESQQLIVPPSLLLTFQQYAGFMWKIRQSLKHIALDLYKCFPKPPPPLLARKWEDGRIQGVKSCELRGLYIYFYQSLKMKRILSH